MPEASLQADYLLAFDYTRSLGNVLGAFHTGLRDRRILGIRSASGKVLVPPQEFDPDTFETLEQDFVEVGPSGTVATWAWVTEPKPAHPLDHPFAWALITLDGADTALLHAVDAGDPSAMSTGMTVAPRWRDETAGSILDIEAFVPAGEG